MAVGPGSDDLWNTVREGGEAIQSPGVGKSGLQSVALSPEQASEPQGGLATTHERGPPSGFKVQ